MTKLITVHIPNDVQLLNLLSDLSNAGEGPSYDKLQAVYKHLLDREEMIRNMGIREGFKLGKDGVWDSIDDYIDKKAKGEQPALPESHPRGNPPLGSYAFLTQDSWTENDKARSPNLATHS